MDKSQVIKRKQFFLKDSSQPKLIVETYFILVLVMTLSGIVFYFVGNKNLAQEYFQAHSTLKSTMQIFLPALVIVNLVGLAAASFLVVAFTHSIAGPIAKLKNLSEKIASGDLSLQVQFRRTDLVPELAETMNAIIQGLNAQIKELKAPLEQLQKLLTKFETLNQPSQEEWTALKEDLHKVSQNLKGKIDQFQL